MGIGVKPSLRNTRLNRRDPTAPGLVLGLPLAEGSGTETQDFSGNGNNASLYSSNPSALGMNWANGPFGYQLNNGGGNNFNLKLANTLDLGTIHTCVAVVLPLQQTGGYNYGVLIGDSVNAAQVPLYVAGENDTSIGYNDADNNGPSATISSILNTPSVLASVRNGLNVSLYCNRSLVGSGSLTVNTQLVISTLGTRCDNLPYSTFPFLGYLISYLLFPRALSFAEIASISDDSWRWCRPVRQPRFGKSSGGNTYPESYSGSCTASGALTRSIFRSLAGSAEPSGVLAKEAQKPFSGGTTLAGSLARLAAKPLAGSSEPAGSLTRQPEKHLAGSSEPAGALTRSADKSLSGSTEPSGALTREAAKNLAGSTGPAGALAKESQKPLSGSTTPAGSLTALKVVVKALAGSVTAAGSLVRSAAKALAGSTSPEGSLARESAKSLAGSSTPGGSLIAVKVVIKSFAGSVTAAGTLTRRAAKGLGATASAAGSLARSVAKWLLGWVTGSGSLTTSGGSQPMSPAGVWSEPTRSIVWTETVRGIVWTGPQMLQLVKRLGESNTVYAYDFASDAVISGGDPIASVVSVAPTVLGPTGAAALNLTDPTYPGTGTKVYITLGGGQDDALYLLTFTVLTVAGATRVGLGKLHVDDDE